MESLVWIKSIFVKPNGSKVIMFGRSNQFASSYWGSIKIELNAAGQVVYSTFTQTHQHHKALMELLA